MMKFVGLFPHISQQLGQLGPLPEIWHLDTEKALIAGFQERIVATGHHADIFDLEQGAGLFYETVTRAVDLIVVDVEAAHHD